MHVIKASLLRDWLEVVIPDPVYFYLESWSQIR